MLALTQGKIAFFDEEDSHVVAGSDWCAVNVHGRWYAVTYRNGQHLYLHHAIMGSTDEVDHIDGDGLNNRRSNLRHCTHQQNLWNARRQANNTSGYRGVSFDKKRGKWLAYIVNGGCQKHLGRFDDPVAAARAHDAAAIATRGKFARLNFTIPME